MFFILLIKKEIINLIIRKSISIYNINKINQYIKKNYIVWLGILLLLVIIGIALVNVFEPKKQKVTTESNDAFFPASQDTISKKVILLIPGIF